MTLQIGDKLFHETYGLGEIARIEEKFENGSLVECYVFQTAEVQIWIPVEKLDEPRLHKFTPPDGERPSG